MDNEKIKRSLRYSLLDGIFASCMSGLTTEYITPYALALKATPKQIGFLNSIPNLIASLFQIKSADITDKLISRKKVISISVFLHALMFLPIISVPFLFKTHSVVWLILFVTLFATFGSFAVAPWLSLMSEYIPENKRGDYFGWRNKILGLITVVFTFIAGFILHKSKQNIFKGFFVIFGLASLFRFISGWFLTCMYEPPFKTSKEHYFSFLDFIKRIKESNFAKFVIFVASLNFSVNLAAPFFAVLMLRDLKFNYIVYTTIVLSATLANLFTIGRWGRCADKFGNIKIIKFTSFFISFIPLFWIINRNPVYLVFAQIFSGFVWSGFSLCGSNFIFDAVSKEKRVRCIAYFNVINGVALCLGSVIGGYLAMHLPPLFGSSILSLFLVSSILRIIVTSLLVRKIKEVRKVDEISNKDLFYSIAGLRPM